MNKLDDLLYSLHFSEVRSVQGRASIADLFPVGQRCGIYVLHFLDDEIYAGQAVDVTRRYVQHCRAHNDIGGISFKAVLRERLSEEERDVIWTLEQSGFQLRNIALTSAPRGNSDFDLVISPEEQQRWLDDPDYQDTGGTRALDREQRRKYHEKFLQFQGLPYADVATDVLRAYVQRGIPFPLRSEMSFWGVSCLPGYSEPGVVIYSRININWQEVFTVFTDREALRFSWHLARSSLQRPFGQSLTSLHRRYPTLEIADHHYEPGGQDQVNLMPQDVKSAQALLDNVDVLRAIRLFNLRLMLKGPCVYSRYHCLDLADILLGVQA